MGEVVSRVRAGGGPEFVLSQTIPWPGNTGWKPTNVGRTDLRRALEEPRGWEPFDAILLEVRALLDEGVPLEAILELDARIVEETEAALAAAIAAPYAPGAVAYDDVLGST